MKEEIRDEIVKKVSDNISYIKDLLKGSSDIVYREFYIGEFKSALVYVDGMGDKVLLDNFVLETLMIRGSR